MHTLEKVQSDSHGDIKVSLAGALANNSKVHMCHIVLSEFADVAQFYPIFFSKDKDTGQFQPVALFGLALDENIYQACGLWEKCYLPLKLQSQPFYLMKDEAQAEPNAKPCLAIDIDDCRVQTQQGEALFVKGKATQYLQQQAALLSELTQGFVLNSVFINALLAHNLLESVTLDIKYQDGQAHKLSELYTINKEMLVKVPANIQLEFEQQGYVALISAALSSVNHVSTLVELKNSLVS